MSDSLSEEVQSLAVPEPTIPENGEPLFGELDANGEPFDREVHTGTKRRDGTWRKRKSKAVEPESQEATTEEKRKNFASIIVDTMIATCVGTFGPDWRASKDERDNLVNASDAVMAEYGIDDLPPVVGLVFAVGVYAVPRIDFEAVKKYFEEQS